MGQANTKYFDLDKKINQARRNGYNIVNANNGATNPYEVYRQEIVDKYFKGSYDKETKEQLLDMFEQVNGSIKEMLGL